MSNWFDGSRDQVVCKKGIVNIIKYSKQSLVSQRHETRWQSEVHQENILVIYLSDTHPQCLHSGNGAVFEPVTKAAHRCEGEQPGVSQAKSRSELAPVVVSCGQSEWKGVCAAPPFPLSLPALALDSITNTFRPCKGVRETQIINILKWHEETIPRKQLSRCK